MSKNVQEINSNQRKKIHLAAVIVNNFSNHMFCLGKRILEKEKLSFDILKPLISSTCENAMEDPEKSQIVKYVAGEEKYYKNMISLTITSKVLEFRLFLCILTTSQQPGRY